MSKHHTSQTEPAAKTASGTVLGGNDTQELETERLAYSYWEARGRTEGSAEDDWARAEQEMKALRL
ncbi:MAG: DUF2934 domain-containing protein [Nitrospirota bacterium]